ncbi:LADA_0D00804g1_1 [Lachancea dasiensis]|uniref:LADA_0D00804g1_1 n=1 Tax=Lachancea dasiensis TaxID=1072105 RepID=A0A1G4J3G1_9SACH|nr:LADA_0D00804g1_1 [Lachancea dasiensis]
MNTIVFKHSQTKLSSLSIAGNFTQWDIKPMVFNDQDQQWEFQLDQDLLAKCEVKGGKAVTLFKFIDDSGTWFTDDNFAKESDEVGNENNAMYMTLEEMAPQQQEESVLGGGEGGGVETSVGVADEEVYDENGDDYDEEELIGRENEPSSPDPTPMNPVASQETPVVINESDLEDNYHETQEQSLEQNRYDGPVSRSRQGSAETDVSTKGDPKDYNNLLHSIIFFFRSLFYRWFGVGKREHQ